MFKICSTLLIPENNLADPMARTKQMVENIQMLNIANIFFEIDSSNTKWIYIRYEQEIKYNIYSTISGLGIYSFAQILKTNMNRVVRVNAMAQNIFDFFLVSKVCVVKMLRSPIKNK